MLVCRCGCGCRFCCGCTCGCVCACGCSGGENVAASQLETESLGRVGENGCAAAAADSMGSFFSCVRTLVKAAAEVKAATGGGGADVRQREAGGAWCGGGGGDASGGGEEHSEKTSGEDAMEWSGLLTSIAALRTRSLLESLILSHLAIFSGALIDGLP